MLACSTAGNDGETQRLTQSRSGDAEAPASLASAEPSTSEPALASNESAAERAPSEAPSRVLSTPYTPPSTLGQPIATYRAERPRAAYLEPNHDAPLRGRIEIHNDFHVYEIIEGPDCKQGWAKVDEDAWICLKSTARSEGTPHSLPQLGKGKLVPYVYARHVDHDEPNTAKIPVYKRLAELERGAEPIDWLEPYGTYAFVRKRSKAGKTVLIDESLRAVPAEGLQIFEPSSFAGRDLEASPVPSDRTLAWVTNWKAELRAKPDPESERVSDLEYHGEIYLLGEPERGEDGELWYRVPARREGEAIQPEREGWVLAEHVNRWRPIEPTGDIYSGQLLLDIDLVEQTLTVWREDRPVFATLIASGKPGDSTPLGLYRVTSKRAYGKMASLPDEADPYWVDQVPWTMYFDGRYALHAAFWHNRFGHRTSHGCVNLSPRDAKRIFELTTPTLPPGWIIVTEHAGDPGTLVRVRRDSAAVPDRREPIATREAEPASE